MRSHKEILDTIVIDKYKVDFDDWFLNVISSDKDKLRMMNDVIDKFAIQLQANTMNTCSKIFDSLEFGADDRQDSFTDDELDSHTNPKKDMGEE
jgi:hypothetical protein